ncbi:DUF421 domain-containing protein [Natribacillus halophilus]|uniref:Uncharacterized membrane protein YcaP, DUF421 family n=1 Tax=Natribacillus halophilus TaxID=549003 RepID=A0A1G8J901_9BACI|nr:DUF421 domain-containing protein [Natribacillus halophilus]SDI27467.1 Uncharacterized membrane protein YcaP, DUF421 family [Natribacillus halophilus]
MFIVEIILLFLLTLFIIRMFGHSAFSQITPHDLVAVFFLVIIATSPIEINTLSQAILGIIAVGGLHYSLARLSLLRRFHHLVVGEPVILIKHGKIIKSNLKKTRYSLIELLSSLRSKGYLDIKNIQYAILEPFGELSVVLREDAHPITRKDLNLDVEKTGVPITVVVEGIIQYENLKLLHRDERWLRSQLKEKGYKKLEDVFIATVWDKNHQLMVDDGSGNNT